MKEYGAVASVIVMALAAIVGFLRVAARQRAGGRDPVCYDSGLWLRDLCAGQPWKLKTFAPAKKTIDKCFLTWYYVKASSVSLTLE